MRKAFRLLLCLFLLVDIGVQAWIRADAQVRGDASAENANSVNLFNFNTLPQINQSDFASLIFPMMRGDIFLPPLIFTNETSPLLYNAIAKRLGVRYRFFGIDDRGYDCSGFVWRVYQEAGADFERVAARTLWRQLPEASGVGARQFGNLVFFNNLRHVGIVRDAYSFYHASRSQGVTLSFFAGYWDKRVTGYRRAPMPLSSIPLEIGD